MNREERTLIQEAGLRGMREEFHGGDTGLLDNLNAHARSFIYEDRSTAEVDNELNTATDALRNLYLVTKNPTFHPMTNIRQGQRNHSHGNMQRILEDNKALIEELKGQNPDAGLMTWGDVLEHNKSRASALREKQKSVSVRANTAGKIGGFLGDVTGAMADPINQGTMMMGAPRAALASGTILMKALKVAGYEGSIAGLSETAIQPFVFGYKQKLDSPYTAQDAATNILAATFGGAVLGSGVYGTGEGLVALYRRAVKLNDIKPTLDTEAAAQVLEDVELSGHQNQLTSEQAHFDALDTASAQLRADQPVDVSRVVEGHLPPRGASGGLQSVDPRTLKVDADRFQFKHGTDAEGVTDRLKGIDKWEPELAGVSIVYEDLQGQRFIVDGHQRRGLAVRLIERGDQPADEIVMNSMILREADGFTPEEATARAAIKNIAEGTGTAIDAAKIMRNLNAEALNSLPSLPPNSQLVKDAQGLSGLSDNAFLSVVNGIIDERYAALVGRVIRGDSEQLAALSMLAKAEPANKIQAEAMVRDINAAGFQKADSGDLFGDVPAESLFKERAQVVDHTLRRLRQDKKVFKTLVDRETDILGHGRNHLDSEANRQRWRTDQMALASLMADAHTKGPVSDAVNHAAREVKAGSTPGKASRLVLDALRDSAGGRSPTIPKPKIGRPLRLKEIADDQIDLVINEFLSAQSGRSIDEHINLSRAPHDQLGLIGKEIEEKLGERVFFSHPPIKKKARIEEKLNGRHSKNAGEITDVARAGFIVDDYTDVDQIIKRFGDELEVLDEGIEVKPEGYFDHTIKVRFKNGTVGEVQFWDPALLIAKSDDLSWVPQRYLDQITQPKVPGHDLYAMARKPDVTPERARELIDQMRDVYGNAWNQAAPSWKFASGRESTSANFSVNRAKNDSADMTLALENASARGNSSQNNEPSSPLMAQARSDESTTTGTRSQSANIRMSSQESKGSVISVTSKESIPQEDSEVFAAVNKLFEENPNAVVPDLVVTDEGVEVVTRSAREVFQELDDEADVIKNVINCMGGGNA